MAQISYWVVYGTIRENGVGQSGKTVTIRNDTRSEEHAVQTDADGKYSITITRTDWFPSGCYEGDTIKVTYGSTTAQFQTNISTHPWGRKVSFHLHTMTETVEATHQLKLPAIHYAFTQTVEATHQLSQAYRDYLLAETLEATHLLHLRQQFSLTETLEGTHQLFKYRGLTLTEILQATHMLVTSKIYKFADCLEGTHELFRYRILHLTESVDAVHTLAQPLKVIVLEQIAEPITVLELPYRLWVLSETAELVHSVAVSGLVVYLQETVEGLPTVKARRQVALEESIEATHSLLLPLRTIVEIEPVDGIHVLACPVHNLLLSETVTGTPMAYAMKTFPFTETLEGECGVDDLLIIVPTPELIQLTETLEATHQINRHKTLFLTENVEGTPTAGLPSKLVAAENIIEGLPAAIVPLHPILSTQTLDAIHELSAHRIIALTNTAEAIHQLNLAKVFSLIEYVEGLPDLKLPQRPALLQQILTGLPAVSAEFLEPTPFLLRLNIARRNLHLNVQKRNLKLTVRKRKLILRIRGERD